MIFVTLSYSFNLIAFKSAYHFFDIHLSVFQYLSSDFINLTLASLFIQLATLSVVSTSEITYSDQCHLLKALKDLSLTLGLRNYCHNHREQKDFKVKNLSD
jgi:hypothetical protein